MDEDPSLDNCESHRVITGCLASHLEYIFPFLLEDYQVLEESKDSQSPHNSANSENFTFAVSLSANPSSGKKKSRKQSDLDAKKQKDLMNYEQNTP